MSRAGSVFEGGFLRPAARVRAHARVCHAGGHVQGLAAGGLGGNRRGFESVRGNAIGSIT